MIRFAFFAALVTNLVQVVSRIHGIRQRSQHINDQKPPLVVMDDATDFLPLKQRVAIFGIKVGFDRFLEVSFLSPGHQKHPHTDGKADQI